MEQARQQADKLEAEKEEGRNDMLGEILIITNYFLCEVFLSNLFWSLE